MELLWVEPTMLLTGTRRIAYSDSKIIAAMANAMPIPCIRLMLSWSRSIARMIVTTGYNDVIGTTSDARCWLSAI